MSKPFGKICNQKYSYGTKVDIFYLPSRIIFKKSFEQINVPSMKIFCNGITNENIAKLKNGYRPLSKTCSLNFSCNVFFFCSNILQNFCCKKCLLMFIEPLRKGLKLKYTRILRIVISTSVLILQTVLHYEKRICNHISNAYHFNLMS